MLASLKQLLNKWDGLLHLSENETTQVYWRLAQYLRPYKIRALTAVLITIPIGGLDAAIAFSLKPFMDGVILSSADATPIKVTYIPFIIVGFTLMQGLLNYASIYMNGWLSAQILWDMRRDLFRKLQTLDISFFDTTESGTIIQRFFNDPTFLQSTLLDNAKLLLTRFFSSLSLMGVLIFISWKLAIIAIGILLLILYPSSLIRKIVKSITDETANASENILTFYNETSAGARVIYGYNLERQRFKMFEASHQLIFDRTMKLTKAQGWLTPSMHLIAASGIGLIIWIGGQMVLAGDLSPGSSVAFVASLVMLYNPVKNLGNSIVRAQRSVTRAARVINMLDESPNVINLNTAKPLRGLSQGIEFEDVHFSYHSDKPVLRGVNFKIAKGETLALVGNSGGGKSTIVNLLPRFYDVIQGAIRIDGVDIREYSKESLRRQISIVLQDNFLFNGSIRDNLLVGKPQASDEDLADALMKTYLTEFVSSLPQGLDTMIGERGLALSGGQRQRIAIARAILKDAPIVILDEATSALDNLSESIVQKALESLMADRTVIIIAHRLSTIRNVERILVVENGKIAEEGTQAELLGKNSIYAKLHHLQFKQHSSDTLESQRA